MLKILMLMAVILFSGCGDDDRVRPPKMEVLKPRQNIEINVTNGCICGDDKDAVINLIKNIRNDLAYYEHWITIYNSEFVK